MSEPIVVFLGVAWYLTIAGVVMRYYINKSKRKNYNKRFFNF